MRLGHVTRIVNAVVPNPFPRESKIQYGVATISRLLKIIGLFANEPYKRDLYSGKETYNFKEPTNCSHPIVPNPLSPDLLRARYSCI